MATQGHGGTGMRRRTALGVVAMVLVAGLGTGCGPSVGNASVTLDPARPPDPASSELHVLVTEQDCNSGMDAEGRVELVRLDEDDANVEIRIGVRPESGDASCPDNPPTPFTVVLERPLGDRALLDAAKEPARALEMPRENGYR